MSYDSYYQSYLKQNQSVIDAQKKVLEDEAEANINLIKTSADKSIDDINRSYEDEIQSANESAENAHQKNEVQRLLNERYLERKAAEIGLTDSGMNRTQLTANQLSYGNQKSEIDNQRQKAVSTLAAAMASKVSDIEIKRDSKLFEVDTGLKSAKAQVDASLASQADEYAREMYKADLENAAKYTYVYDKGGNVTGKFTKDERDDEWKNLVSALELNAFSDENAAAQAIYDFYRDYDMSDSERSILLKKAELTEGEFKTFVGSLDVNDKNGNIYTSQLDYGTKIKKGEPVGRVEWNYETAGPQRYLFKIKKATKNWGNNVDYNDEVTIYYPDGTLLAENVPLKNFPKTEYADVKNGNKETSVRQSITNRTANKKVSNNQYDFYFTVDLKGLKI